MPVKTTLGFPRISLFSFLKLFLHLRIQLHNQMAEQQAAAAPAASAPASGGAQAGGDMGAFNGLRGTDALVDMLDKGVNFVAGKTGKPQSRATVEKISDGLRKISMKLFKKVS